MQTLYGIKITDRVTVTESKTVVGNDIFDAHFDGEFIERCTSGRAAVNSAIEWLRKRSEAQVQKNREDTLRAERNQECEDASFLHDLATRLGIDPSDLDELIEIANRRGAQ